MNKPKVLLLDIETSPILAYCWSIWEQNIPLNQIKQDWHVLAWSAKWLGEKKMFYMDQRNAKNIEDDTKILKGVWELMDAADVLITQNGKRFDVKKLNARFVLNGMKPPSSFRHIDTHQLAKKHFGFTSNKLEYMSDKLCKKYKKQKHSKFGGFELWKGCISGNRAAWKEMETYNKYDVLSLEELYTKLAPWDTSVTLASFDGSDASKCDCGGNLLRWGYRYSNRGKYQRFKCENCGAERRGTANHVPLYKRKEIKA